VVGSVNVDLVVMAERFAAPDETMTGRNFQILSGGKGANQAAAAARLGTRTLLFARVGSDSFALGLLNDLEEAGVDITYVELTPGSAGAAVDGGQNSIVVVPGANGTVQPADIDRWWPAIREAGSVLAQLEIPLEAVTRLAAPYHRQAARGQGTFPGDVGPRRQGYLASATTCKSLSCVFFEALSLNPPPEGSRRDAELLGNLRAGELAAFPKRAYLLVLMAAGLFLPASHAAPRARRGKAGHGALANQVALELGQHREHMEDQLSAGGLRVDLLGKRDELDAAAVEPLHDFEQIG